MSGRLLLKVLLPIGVGLLLLAIALMAWWLQRPAPSYEGTLALAGLGRPVAVRYGPHAVPSIRADSLADMVFAQGFVVARERLWQMDLLRRLAGGRLAELFGEPALNTDRFYRTIGLRHAAERSFQALAPRWQELLAHYAQGVNAYRTRALSGWRLPLEYQLLGQEPAPWQPQDSLLVGAYMAWLNASNLREELVFLRLAQRLGTRRALALFPTRPGEPAPRSARNLPDYRLSPAAPTAADARAKRSLQLPALVRAETHTDALVAQAGAQAASNAWAVAGRLTGNGALLANDPHLPAQIPSPWYELELEAPDYHAAGVVLPGVPGILIGHNEHLAWGITASAADTQDLFLERLSEDGRRVQRPGGESEPIRVRTEAIRVAGRDAPLRLQVRSTRHGVLIDDLVAAPEANPAGLPSVQRPERLALKQTLSEIDRSLVGLFRLNQARTLEEARSAVRDLRQVSLNILFAHRNGRIAWQVTGLLPVRGRGSGAFPVPGWEPGYGWTGFRPFAKNPGLSDPLSGRLVNANNAMRASQASPPISYAWLAPFRAHRIEALLAQSQRLDADEMARMQSDRVSEEARLYLAALRRQMPALDCRDPQAAALARSRLLAWSGEFAADSRAAAFFVLLRPALYRALYGDELGADLEALMSLEQVTYGPLAETMRADRSRFWDDVRTPHEEEGPAVIWARALRAAEHALNEALPEQASQTLGQLRRLTFEHAFAGQPLLGRLFNLGPFGRGGDNGTIDVAIAPQARPRRIGNVPSLRVVYTPAEWSKTQATLPLGQSGHRFSPFRADQLADWRTGRTHHWPWEGPAAGQVLGTLTLVPASG